MGRILLAEDDNAIRALVKRALELDGHVVVPAEDGATALATLVRDSGRFDLLLSDIQMPVMDGIALTLAVARDHRHLTVLLMTGYAHQRERAHGLTDLVHDVVTKPFSVAEIRRAVTSALQRQGDGRAVA